MFSYFARHLIQRYRSRHRKVVDLNQEYTIGLRSWLSDCDMNLHVNSSRYIVYLEIARYDISLGCGLDRFCRANKFMPLVMGTKLTFRREIKPLQRFKVSSRVCAIDSRFIYFEQKIHSDFGDHCKAYIRVALYKGGKFVDPATLRDALGVKLEEKDLADDLKAWIDSETLSLKSIN